MERDTPHGCFVQKLWPKSFRSIQREYPPQKRVHILTLRKFGKSSTSKVPFLGKGKLVGGLKHFFFTPIWGKDSI